MSHQETKGRSEGYLPGTDINEGSFLAELWSLGFMERCIVLGIVMGTPQREILKVLNITPDDYRKKIHDEGLHKWKILKHVFGN